MAQPKARPVDALLRRSDIDGLEPVRHVHQHNANAIRLTRSLSNLTGLEALGVHLVTLTQGHFSTEYHRHHEDEEFIYILSGRGLARIGEHQHDVAPGDFMGFNTRSEAHSLYNPNPEDLIYLMGGTRCAIDICDYPDLDLRQFRVHGDRTAVQRKYLTGANPLTDRADPIPEFEQKPNE
jgi:uncharacterized cupin superfamily protein